MTSRKKQSKTDRQPHPEQQVQGIPPFVWWLASLLFLLGANPHWLQESVRIVDWRAGAVLTPEAAWSAPLANWSAADSLAQWPYLAFACVAAGVLAAVATNLSRSVPSWLVACFVAGAGLSFPPKFLLPAVMIVAAARITQSRKDSEQRWPMCLMLAGLGVFAALSVHEFGFVWLVIGLLLIDGLRATAERSERWPRCRVPDLALLAVGVGVVAVAGLVGSGFGATVLRPVNWLGVTVSASLMPGLDSAFAAELRRIPMLLLASVTLWKWAEFLRSGGRSRGSVPILAILPAIGLGCAHFCWLCLFSVGVVLRPDLSSKDGPNVETPQPADRLTKRLLVVAALAMCLRHFETCRETLLSGDASKQSSVTAASELKGPVLLMSPDMAQHWQTAVLRQRQPLLIDDRWEVFAGEYRDYASACRDIVNVRMDSFVRTDGSWGGYTRWMREQQPRLLVLDSRQTDDIRSLSLSPHWKVVRLDVRQVVFAQADAQENADVIRKAGSVLVALEFGGADVASAGFVIPRLVNDDDRRAVAGALNALRLPTAALRVLQDCGRDSATDRLRTLCWLDLAHRTRRHTGRSSMLYQYRAVRMLQQAAGDSSWEQLELAGIERGLAQIAGDDSSATEDDERQLRQALLQGDDASARAALDAVSPDRQQFFQTVLDSGKMEPVDSLALLIERLNGGKIPEGLRAEAWFYAGCLALEVGDGAIAREAFLFSHDADPESPFAPLRDFYLRRLVPRR